MNSEMSNQEVSNMSDESASSDTNPYHTLIKLENITTESRFINGTLKFFPPMYIQRYEAVSLILKRLQWNDSIKKAVDFGCAELGFFLHLKYIPSISEILEVDIDEDVLVRCATRAAPLNADYLFSKRNKPLNVYLLAGSIGDFDDQLQGTDVVVAIEVLEHLNREVLEKVPYNIFHNIKPRIAIFTTPNADFNVLFTNMGRFRHIDHKFEWTRMELVKWTQEVVAQYPDYFVKLYEIGVGPEETEHLGCCTQIAVFERKPEFDEEFSQITLKRGINNYKLVREYIYPFYVDERPNELKIFHEVEYRLKFTFHVNKFFNTEEELFEIPLEDIYPYVNEWCESEDELRSVLLEHGFYVLEREGMQYLSYRGYMSDSSDAEENESVEMNVAEEENERIEGENWEWNCSGTNPDPNFNPNPNPNPDPNLNPNPNPNPDPNLNPNPNPDPNPLPNPNPNPEPEPEPQKDDEVLEICPEENFANVVEMDNACMDASSTKDETETNGAAGFDPSTSFEFNSSDTAMVVDQEMEVRSRSMVWSAIPQRKDEEMGPSEDDTDRL